MNTLLFIIWLFFRLLSSSFVALISSILPITDLEKSTPLFASGLPLDVWLERVFLSPWQRWDAIWYLRIIEKGYSSSNGTAQFHPLYPGLASIFAWLGLHPLLSLLLISSLACLGFLWIYTRLASLDLPSEHIRFSILLMVLAPAAFVLFAPYSEALFLLCAVLSFYLARQKKWWLAALMAAFAALTRQQGLILFLPLAWELWEDSGCSWQAALSSWRNWLSLFFVPFGYVLWLGFRLIILNDLFLDISSMNSAIYSLLISDSASEVVPIQRFLWPWHALWLGIKKLFTEPDPDIWVNFIAAGMFLLILCLGWKSMRVSYRLYALAITVLSFSYYTGPLHPYMGLPRHLLLAFPVFIAATPRIDRPIFRPIFLFMLGFGYISLLFFYSLEAWVP